MSSLDDLVRAFEIRTSDQDYSQSQLSETNVITTQSQQFTVNSNQNSLLHAGVQFGDLFPPFANISLGSSVLPSPLLYGLNSAPNVLPPSPQNRFVSHPRAVLSDAEFQPTAGLSGTLISVRFRWPDIIHETELYHSCDWICLRSVVPHLKDLGRLNYSLRECSVPISVVEVLDQLVIQKQYPIGNFVYETFNGCFVGEADLESPTNTASFSQIHPQSIHAHAVESNVIHQENIPNDSFISNRQPEIGRISRKRRSNSSAGSRHSDIAAIPSLAPSPAPSVDQIPKDSKRRNSANTGSKKLGHMRKHTPLPSQITHPDFKSIVWDSAKEIYFRSESEIKSLVHGWSVQEKASGRRLVLFERAIGRRNGVEITARPIPPDIIREYRRQDGHIVVSCIHWSEKRKYFISSVDLVYLIKHLLNLTTLTAIDKNRIRRNLEGLHPITVSRGDVDWHHSGGNECFYQQIMGYGDPMPRLIDKDIKMYEWNFLPPALTKVVGKYGNTQKMASPLLA